MNERAADGCCQSSPIVSGQVCVELAVVLVLGVLFVSTLYVAWSVIVDAMKWRRLCVASGGRGSADTVLDGAEQIAKAIR